MRWKALFYWRWTTEKAINTRWRVTSGRHRAGSTPGRRRGRRPGADPALCRRRGISRLRVVTWRPIYLRFRGRLVAELFYMRASLREPWVMMTWQSEGTGPNRWAIKGSTAGTGRRSKCGPTFSDGGPTVGHALDLFLVLAPVGTFTSTKKVEKAWILMWIGILGLCVLFI